LLFGNVHVFSGCLPGIAFSVAFVLFWIFLDDLHRLYLAFLVLVLLENLFELYWVVSMLRGPLFLKMVQLSRVRGAVARRDTGVSSDGTAL